MSNRAASISAGFDIGILAGGHLPRRPILAFRVLAAVEQSLEIVHALGRGEKPRLSQQVSQRWANTLPGLLQVGNHGRFIDHYGGIRSAAARVGRPATTSRSRPLRAVRSAAPAGLLANHGRQRDLQLAPHIGQQAVVRRKPSDRLSL